MTKTHLQDLLQDRVRPAFIHQKYLVKHIEIITCNTSLAQRVHIRSHSSAQCRHCRRRFASAHGLLLHRKLRPCSAKTLRRSAGKPEDAKKEERDDDNAVSAAEEIAKDPERGEVQGEGFVCPRCGQAFTRIYGLVEHIKSPVACQRRQSKAQTDAALTEKGSWRCAKCDAEFKSRGVYQDHAAQSKSCGSKAGVYDCAKCGFRCSAPYELRAHFRAPKACRARVRERELRRRLGDQAFGSATRCPQCQRSYASWNHLRAHLRYSSSCGDQDKSYVCDTCEAAFSISTQLVVHRRTGKACLLRRRLAGISASSAADGQVCCPKCQTPFGRRYTLLEHLRQSRSCGSDRDRYHCIKCSAPFPQLYELRNHQMLAKACQVPTRRIELLRETAEPDSSGNLACQRCQALFANVQLLLDHLNASKKCSDKAKAFVCGKCSHRFDQLHQLANHQRRGNACTTNQKRTAVLEEIGNECGEHRCLRCRKLFDSATEVSIHMAFGGPCASRLVSVTCPTCQATFPGPVELGRHRSTGKACRIRLRQQSLAATTPGPQTSRPADPTPNLALAAGPHLQPKLRFASRGASEFSCSSCQTSYATKKCLLMHLRGSRSCGDHAEEYACDDCGAAFPHAFSLAKHRRTGKACRIRLRQRAMRELLSPKPDMDDAKISTKAESHVEERHRAVPLVPVSVKCRKCGKVFRDRNILLMHLSKSRSCGDRAERYPCPGCGLAFPTPSCLAKHQRSPVACRLARQRSEVRQKAELGPPVKDPARCPRKELLLRCPSCAYMTISAYAMGQHQSKPKACRFQSSRIQALCGSLASSACPNCGEEQGDARALMEHLAHGSECVKMRGFDEPVIPLLLRRLGLREN